MDVIITLIILIFLSLFMIVRKKRYPLDAFNMTIFLFMILYVLIPEVLPLSYGCYPFCDGVSWLIRFVALIGLGTFIFGFYFSKVLPVFSVNKTINLSEKYQFKVVLFMTGISFYLLYTYAQSFGGFINAFSYGAIMRFTGENIIEVNSQSAIIIYFTAITYIVFTIAQYKLHKKTNYKKRYLFIILLSILIILSISIINGSRGAIFQVFLIALFIYFNLNGMKVTLKRMIITISIILVGLFFVANGKSAIASVSKVFQGENFVNNTESKSFEYVYGRLILEFSHPIKSLGVVMNNQIEFNGMSHFLNAPLDLIPTKLLGLNTQKPTRIHEINSKLVAGDSETGIPPGIIASFWYGGGIISVLFGMFMSGVFIGWIQRQSYNITSVYPEFTPIVLYIFFKFSWFINNGDLSVFLKSQVHIVLFFSLLIVFLFLYSLYKLFFRSYMMKKHILLKEKV